MQRLLALSMLLVAQSLAAQHFAGLSEAIGRSDFGNLKAVVISRHGDIIFEGYFRGTQPDDLHQVHSVTKSVGSALIGIAHRQGKIRLDQDLEHFFSPLYPMSTGAYRDKRPITVAAVLQQRHGIQWDELSVDYRNPHNSLYAMISSSDWYRHVLSRPTDAQPGEIFTYSTGASSLMSRMVRSATGMGPHAFAMQELFGPLGIGQVHWEGFSEQGMGHGFTDWRNPDNDQPLGFCLWLRPLDMIKFGELYLNGGVYDGRRIIDSSWIQASVTAHSHSGNSDFFTNPNSGYGYQWWITKLTDARDRTWNSYYASGWGRQHILVFPQLGLVVASVADDYDYSGPGIGSILANHVLPELQPRLDQRFNGAWYDPATDGQGLTLEILENGERLVGFWYTYGDNHAKRWFVLIGSIEDSEADVSIIQTSGGAFLQSDPVTETEWGTGKFSAIDCDHLAFEIESAEISTSVTLTRLTGNCEKD